ncbi:hypothetical protein LF1_49030 [Rubripirellula obstinata]|uniref:DUF1573 domain-containing protein n=1 Tax=Rubripirellula obstinata TaxID=406547 RepID=A0A5B1CR58_9BACT|nr:DUF1573 domain-containing protein [Rubripirellula obstinata]KAA1262339.1 hypothetical protein LF1_49030 [Rubripirellula obstinata]
MRFLICVALAAFLGAAGAWALNHNRFGYREAKFGPFDLAGEVNIDNVTEHVTFKSEGPGLYGSVQLIGESRFDFGVMAPGAEGEHLFKVKNVGQKELNLRIGASTCKCTVGDLDKSSLQPGEETDVKLSWTVKQGVREFSQSAQLITTDPKSPAVTLEIIGKVVGDFEYVPDVWTFNEVATGEYFEIIGEVYNYTDKRIEPGELSFSNDKLTELAEFDIQRIPESEFKEVRETAIEGFRVTTKVAPGLRQGAISQNLLLPFTWIGEEEGSSDDAAESSDQPTLAIPTRGRVVGSISMIESSKLKGSPGGGYQYDFGKISRDDSLTAKTFVVLKGKERDNTTLRVGKTAPEGVVQATLGEPKSRGSMVLYPLTLELIPGKDPIERLGKNKDDYGKVWIESDNPLVSKMGIVLTFAIQPR